MMEMIKIEYNYPNLVNCLGRLDYYNRKCQGCQHPYACLQIRREIKDNPDFMSVKERQRKRRYND